MAIKGLFLSFVARAASVCLVGEAYDRPHPSPMLQTVPENRVYVSPDRADAFVRSFLDFSHGRVLSDEVRAPGVEIGRPGDTYRRITIESKFGKSTALVTDGHLPYPYGREITG